MGFDGMVLELGLDELKAFFLEVAKTFLGFEEVPSLRETFSGGGG